LKKNRYQDKLQYNQYLLLLIIGEILLTPIGKARTKKFLIVYLMKKDVKLLVMMELLLLMKPEHGNKVWDYLEI
jgi:hypothetical protein